VIAFLEGRVAERSAGSVVLDVGGVGYQVAVPVSTAAGLPPVGRPARLFTRMQVRDDAMLLFGFASADERSLFDLLVTVNGIGPKVALAFLSALPADALRRAVASGDVAALTVVPGVGKKVAQRVILDLKDKLGGDVVVLEGPLVDVREALLSLGLSPQEAAEAIAALAPEGGRPVEELLREALQRVGPGSAGTRSEAEARGGRAGGG
jgi:holliday junction DNA helicase RuvA